MTHVGVTLLATLTIATVVVIAASVAVATLVDRMLYDGGDES